MCVCVPSQNDQNSSLNYGTNVITSFIFFDKILQICPTVSLTVKRRIEAAFREGRVYNKKLDEGKLDLAKVVSDLDLRLFFSDCVSKI